jgi:DNA polymerase-3 subunit delta
MLPTMSAEPLEPLYLLTGGDLPKIRFALRRLRARFDPGSVDMMFAEQSDAEGVVAAANALGLFAGGERLVVVEGVEKWKKPDVEIIARYGADPSPGAVVALVGDDGKLPAGLEEACASGGKVLRYELPKRRRGSREVEDFVEWTRRQLEQAGVQVERGVAERLVQLVGDDAFALQSEGAKLAAWSGGEPITVRDVERLVAPSDDMPGWALADSWGARDISGALGACEAQLQHDEPFLVAYRLAEHVAKVRAAQALLDDDVSVGEIARRMGLKPYPARKQAEQARNFAPAELAGAVVRLADLDHAVKGGSRLDATLELERAIVEVTNPVPRPS